MKELKMLNIYDIFKINQSEFIYKWKNGIDNFKTIYSFFFEKQEQIHRYNTRQRNNYRKPKFKNKYGKQTITYTAADIWNTLTDDIKLSKSVKELKSKLKKSYLLNYN